MPAVTEKILDEEFISEKIENEIERYKKQLESAFLNETFWSAIADELDELEEVLAKDRSKKKGFLVLSNKLNESFQKISELLSNYKKGLDEDSYRNLQALCSFLQDWGKITKIFYKTPTGLNRDSSATAFRNWASALKIIAKLVDDSSKQISLEDKSALIQFARYSLKASEQPVLDDSAKERHRRQVRETATFIAYRLCLQQKREEEKEKAEKNPWKLVLRERPYNQLLKESQSKIDLLDQLYSGEEEEAREQAETIEYLERELNKN